MMLVKKCARILRPTTKLCNSAARNSSYTVPAPRGRQPPPPNNPYIAVAALVATGAAIGSRIYVLTEREKKSNVLHDALVAARDEPDFSDFRMPVYARKLGEGPCAETFGEAWKCALGAGSNCQEKFVEFLSCLKDHPEMLKGELADGTMNWKNKDFIASLVKTFNSYPLRIAKVGEAEDDFDQIVAEAKALEKLGPNASKAAVKKEVDACRAKENAFMDAVKKLHDNPGGNTLNLDKAYKAMMEDCSMKEATFLQALEATDPEYFDQYMTDFRLFMSSYAMDILSFRKVDELSSAEFSKTTCGDQWNKFYSCLGSKKDYEKCMECVDDLALCRARYTSMVRPYMPQFNRYDESYQKEEKRLCLVLKTFVN